jgi:hypothetical protein
MNGFNPFIRGIRVLGVQVLLSPRWFQHRRVGQRRVLEYNLFKKIDDMRFAFFDEADLTVEI